MSIPDFRTPDGRPPKLQVPAPLPPAPKAEEEYEEQEQVEATSSLSPEQQKPFPPVQRPLFPPHNEAAQASQRRQQEEYLRRTQQHTQQAENPTVGWQRPRSAPVTQPEEQQVEPSVSYEPDHRTPPWRRGTTVLPTHPEQPQEPEQVPSYENQYPTPEWSDHHEATVVEPEQQQDEEQKPKRSKLVPVLVAIIAVLALLCGYLLFDKFTNTSEGNSEQLTSLQEENNQLREELEQKNALLEAREGFVAALAPINESIAAAEGKVDVTSNVQTINAARETVAVERENPANIEEQTRIVEEEGTKITEALTMWEQENGATPEPASETDVERALADVSDGNATVAFVDSPCGTPAEQATACVSSEDPSVVQVATRYSEPSEITYELWRMIMAHEYSHTIQYSAGEAFLESESYRNAFDSDSEWYADCMAEAFIGETYQSTYDYECSAEQLEFGREAWNGNFV